MQRLTKERLKRPAREHSKKTRIKRRRELMESYRETAEDNFKVKKEESYNDLINLKLKKYMHK